MNIILTTNFASDCAILTIISQMIIHVTTTNQLITILILARYFLSRAGHINMGLNQNNNLHGQQDEIGKIFVTPTLF